MARSAFIESPSARSPVAARAGREARIEQARRHARGNRGFPGRTADRSGPVGSRIPQASVNYLAIILAWKAGPGMATAIAELTKRSPIAGRLSDDARAIGGARFDAL